MRSTALLSTTALAALMVVPAAHAAGPYFERVATLPVYATLPEGTDPKTATSAEIITATPDGMTLIFTDSPGKRIGFVDIADPTTPMPAARWPWAASRPRPRSLAASHWSRSIFAESRR